MRPSARLERRVVLGVFAVLAGGTAGYYWLEDGWSLLDAFYMTVITLTTIGFGEVHNLSDPGRMFTVALVVCGLGTFAVFVSQFAGLMVDDNLRRAWGRKRMEKRTAGFRDHYIVCGFGRIGKAICSELEEVGIRFVVVESADHFVESAEQRGVPVIRGDATTDLALTSAGIGRAVGLVAALGSDADNLYVSLAARELNPELYIVARGEDEGSEGRMLRAGADKVVSPMRLGGLQIAQIISRRMGRGDGRDGGDRRASALGYRLRLYRNHSGRAVTVADALATTGALQAVAWVPVDGETEPNPTSDRALSEGEGVVLVVPEAAAGRKERADVGARASWDEDLSVGILSLDLEHQRILGLIQRLSAASERDEREAIAAVLEELADYSAFHFRHEERLFEEHGYPDGAEHSQQHQELTRKVQALRREQAVLCRENFAEVLRDWLREHILGTDRRYAEFLCAKGVT